MHRIVSIALLYSTLAFVLLLILGAVAQSEPTIINFLAVQEGSLSFMTKAEASHMQDVAALLRQFFIGAFVATALVVLYAQYKPMQSVARDSFIMSLVLIALLVPFQYTFTWFHEAFFPQGNWQFPADSWLITHFPPIFFITVGAIWFVGAAVLLALLSRMKNASESLS